MTAKNLPPGLILPTGRTRREFLGSSAMALAGALAAGSLENVCLNGSAAAAEPLTFAFWPWGSEIVQQNADDFAKQYGETINLQPIPGEYAAVLETKLAAHAPIDLFRAQRGQASRWYAAGWIRPIDDMPDLAAIQKDMFPGINQDSKAWPDGKFMGLTDYNGGPFCLFRNEEVLGKAGYKATDNPSDYPQTWDDVTKQALDIKQKGIAENPILPAWYKAWTGLPWALISDCFSEGEKFVSPDMKATFGPDTPILKVLSRWKEWWDKDLLPKAILSWQDTQMSNSWMKGLHAFHPYIDYQSFIYNDAKTSGIQKYNNMNPIMPGATHDTVLVGHALLCMSNRKRSPEDLQRLWQLMKFMGWRDKNGKMTAKVRWAEKANLEVPFPAVYDDPEVKAAILKWMYPPLAEVEYRWLFEGRQRALAPDILKAPWYQEWDTVMHDTISQDMLLSGSKPPKQVVTELRSLWDKLHKKYT